MMRLRIDDRVTLRGQTRVGIVNHVIDGNADVPYYWVYWLATKKIRGHRETDLAIVS
jgi:rRNA processing protein Gar1